MWEAFAEHAEDRDIPVLLNHRCVAINHTGGRVESVVVNADGERERVPGVDAVLSSIPLPDLIEASTRPPRPRCAPRRAGCATATSAWSR